jgi:delta-aminolevulinic acid dehydratase/porphobilinogen synthase
MANEKLKRHKSPGIGQIPAEMIKIGVEQFTLITINLLILFGISMNCLRSGKSQSLYLSIRVIKHTVVIIQAYHLCQLHKNFIHHSAVKVK